MIDLSSSDRLSYTVCNALDMHKLASLRDEDGTTLQDDPFLSGKIAGTEGFAHFLSSAIKSQ